MSEICVYLQVEPYLAQWYTHEQGGSQPVHPKRGSAESDLLEAFLRPLPEGELPDTGREANLAIAIPYFKRLDPRTNFYLPPVAKRALAHTLYTRFRVQLWEEMHRLENIPTEMSVLIYAWMEKHGIEDTESNFFLISKMYYRKRGIYAPNFKKKRLS